MDFVHLKCHTEYSLVDGMIRIAELIERTQALKMFAVAVTDYHNLFALIKFYQQAIAAGIKPIIGAELCVLDSDLQDTYRIAAYCQNQQGYSHLIQLVSRAYLEGQSHQHGPTIRWEWLQQWNEGLLLLSGGMAGDIGKALLSNRQRLAEERLIRWLSTFPNRYYIELHRVGQEGEAAYLKAAVELASTHHVPVAATHAACFLSPQDFEAHEARVCIASGERLNDPKRVSQHYPSQHFRSREEMMDLFKDLPEALENTVEIAKRCTVTLSLGKVCLPDFSVPSHLSLTQYIDQEANRGLSAFFEKAPAMTQEKQKIYHARLKMELDIIHSMGFAGYFLIVADFVAWAKSKQIPVGPGRGSGAGSLVAFCLGITALDPIQHGLLFERFLNPERVSMTDFDIDFCMERRDEVIAYVVERYGHQAVAQIATHGTMAAKAVIRDVGRVLGMPYGYVDAIAKLIPFEIGITLRKAMAEVTPLADRYHEEDEVKQLMDLAMKLEGITRNAGKHAGGVVIAPTQLTDFSPLYCEPDGKNIITQFDKDDVEAVGLVKFDFLGLRTLTIIHHALQAIPDAIDITQIPLDDQPTYQLLHRCETTAIFQLESRGMKELVRRLQPDHFEDLTALIALFRPGPLQSGMVDDYIDRKHGRAAVRDLHPDLEPILRPTYGVMLYQEQVMRIAQVLAGFSLGRADILRRAMGKKKIEDMLQQRTAFVEGAVARSVPRETANTIFDLIEKFAGYGFNKSHSAAYALISYQTAWLKAHYPAYFMAAVLSADMDNTDKLALLLKECSRMGLTVHPPHINRSGARFFVNEQHAIEYGLSAIKGVGDSVASHIVATRKAEGDYHDLFDFCQRLHTRKVNKRAMEALILSGAMDDLNQHRATLLASLPTAMRGAEQCLRRQEKQQMDLFDTSNHQGEGTAVANEYIAAECWPDAERLQREQTVLGCYLSGHPLHAYEQELSAHITAAIAALDSVSRNAVTVAGIITHIRVMKTKQNRRMAVVTLEDCSGQIEVTCFSQLYDAVLEELKPSAVVLVQGALQEDRYTGGLQLLAESVETLDQMRARRAKRLILQVDADTITETTLSDLSALLSLHLGPCPVVIRYGGADITTDLQLDRAWCVQPTEVLLLALKKILNETGVVLEY